MPHNPLPELHSAPGFDEHLWTARPPLLLNQRPQASHFTEPLCSSTGLALSLEHLCLALSASLLNSLLHTAHSLPGVSTSSAGFDAAPLIHCRPHTTLSCPAPSHTTPLPQSPHPSYPSSQDPSTSSWDHRMDGFVAAS